MSRKDYRTPKPQPEIDSTPFSSAEEAWFWFIQAQEARNDGARFSLGAGLIPRPCCPTDVMAILDRLYRQRRLLRDHLLVLRHYGRRMLPPDPRRVKEFRAYTLWTEALARLAPAFLRKGIIKDNVTQLHFMEAAE
jgi:hypothetical protein